MTSEQLRVDAPAREGDVDEDVRLGGKRRIAEVVRANRERIVALSHAIHTDPEPAFEEHHAARAVAEAVAAAGYEVELPAGSLATAVRGRLAGGLGAAGPRIGILAEYDALPGLGHGCGHNTMAASGVGAAIALASLRERFAGEIVFLGTPAEEFGSGKVHMIRDGLFAGLDAALLFHPSDIDTSECRLLAVGEWDVIYRGLQAHASSDPWKGRNALDALILLFTSVGLWRQQLRPEARVHGIVLEGGTAANIIPDRAVGRFMVRSPDQVEHGRMRDRFFQLARSAALAADVEVELVDKGSASTMHDNRVLRDLWRANATAFSVPDREPPADQLGSSDMGDVSWVVPAIHPQLAICPEGVAGHSIAFRDAAATPLADEVTLLAATLVAQTAWDLLAEPSLVTRAWEDFHAR
jgi:amidohydrolase